MELTLILVPINDILITNILLLTWMSQYDEQFIFTFHWFKLDKHKHYTHVRTYLSSNLLTFLSQLKHKIINRFHQFQLKIRYILAHIWHIIDIPSNQILLQLQTILYLINQAQNSTIKTNSFFYTDSSKTHTQSKAL